MDTFNPLNHDFRLLEDFKFPGKVNVFEYRNHPAVNGSADFLRLNLYLSKDSNFVVIWSGLVEPIFAESRISISLKIPDFSFEDYQEPLFRGYIDSEKQANYILRALRLEEHTPHVLKQSKENSLQCVEL